MKIVILSFNHPQLTEKTLRSALQHVLPSQILLVHNGSLEVHQKKLRQLFPEVEHLVLFANRGFSGGANAGLRRAFAKTGTDWVLFLTNDCQLLELSSPPSQVSLTAPLIWARKVGNVDSVGGILEIKSAHLRHCKSEEEFADALGKNYVPGTAFWLHREVFQAVGGFDESLGTYWEDVDFSFCARRAGFPLAADIRTKVLHAVGKTCHKDAHYTTYLFQRNRQRVSLRCARQSGISALQVRASLIRSWGKLAYGHWKAKRWDRLRLLSSAIVDRQKLREKGTAYL